LPRAKCRRRASSPPPSPIAATLSRKSATKARIAAAFAANMSERRSSEVVRTPIAAGTLQSFRLPSKRKRPGGKLRTHLLSRRRRVAAEQH
jgi:hypothetical protein